MNASQTSTTLMDRSAVLTPNGNWVVQTARLVGWFLFLAWRRLMGKILLGILLGLYALMIGVIALIWFAAPPDNRQQIALAQTFPYSLGLAGAYTGFLGIILLCILTGAVIGGEYGFSTQRMMLARGCGRAQLVIAEAVALAALALGVTFGMFALAGIIGVTLGPALGGVIPPITGNGVLEIIGYWLAVSFTLFAYMVIAFFMATLGRSTAAGIGFSLGYVVLETIAGTIFTVVGYAVGSGVGTFIAHVPNWFLATTTGAIRAGTSQSPLSFGLNSGPPPISVAQGIIVTVVYCAALIGLSVFILRRRDVTD